MTLCFDIDDTISRHENRDYTNAIPLDVVVSKMRAAKESMPDTRIVLYTARGMNSCRGDVVLAEKKNRQVLEDWLNRNGVPYDEIIFGKPLADAYIDDKAVSPEAFASLGVKKYRGFSGAEVVRVGNTIVKTCNNAAEQRKWYESLPALVQGVASVPMVYSITLGKIYMEYVAGKIASDYATAQRSDGERLLEKLFRVLRAFSLSSLAGENDVKAYCDYVSSRAAEVGVSADGVIEALERNEVALSKRTFCHGDLSLQNVIVREDGGICLIDPCPKEFFWTWYLDAAKIRASLSGLDTAITGTQYDMGWLIKEFDNNFSENDIEIIKALEKTHYIRVLPYAIRKGDKFAEDKLRKLLSK